MKLVKNGIIAASLWTVVSVAAGAMVVGCSSKPKQSELPNGYKAYGSGDFTLLPFKQVTLQNGLKIYFVKDDSLPRVSLNLLVKTGQREEAKAGVNALTAYLLEQGTQSKTAIQIADELGQLGSNFEVSPGVDFTTLSADSLKSGSDALLNLFADISINPSFKEDEIKRIKSQMRASLIKKTDNPSSYTDSEMKTFVYGSHAYGRDTSGTIDSLDKMRKPDVIRHFLSQYRPNNSTLAVTGNFDPAFEAKVQTVFSKWTSRKITPVKKEQIPAINGLQVKLIVKKGLQQTQVRIAGKGIDRRDPKFLSLRVANEILGGSFASRLNQKVRDDLGLTYSIYSYFANMDEPGTFNISTFTKNETAGKTLDESLLVLKNYAQSGADSKELSAGKAQLIGQYPRAIETSDKFAFNLLYLDFYGLGIEYLTNFEKNVNALSKSEISKAFSETVNAGNLKVLVYGDESIIPQFEKYKPEVVTLK